MRVAIAQVKASYFAKEENEVYLLASGQTGEEYYGHSKIIDYEENILAEFEEEEGLKIAEIDLAREEKWRQIVTFLEDRRPEFYRPQVL